MPQFDFYSFSTQVFYVLLFFSFFHFFLLNYIVIPFGKVLKLRQKLFNTYLYKNVLSFNIVKPINIITFYCIQILFSEFF